MIRVTEGVNEQWLGRVVGLDETCRMTSVRVNFYTADRRYRNHYVPESRRTDCAHINSVMGIAQGRWEMISEHGFVKLRTFMSTVYA